MSAADYAHLACPNPDCPSYAQRGAGSLRLHGWSGSGHRIRCLHCVTCGTDFSERANTPLFGLRTPEDKLVAIAEHLADNARTFGFALDADDLAAIEPVLARSRDLMRLIGDCGDEYRR